MIILLVSLCPMSVIPLTLNVPTLMIQTSLWAVDFFQKLAVTPWVLKKWSNVPILTNVCQSITKTNSAKASTNPPTTPLVVN